MKRRIVKRNGRWYVTTYVGGGHWLTMGQGMTQIDARAKMRRLDLADRVMAAEIKNWKM